MVRFYTLDINHPESKNLKMEPGEYQVWYQKGPERSVTPVIKLAFAIKSNKETEVLLK